MSAYTNFIDDFPVRCLEILDTFEELATFHKREVTLTLAIASAGLIIPYERLRPPNAQRELHPFGDRDKYETATKKLDALEVSLFCGSELWSLDSGSWKTGQRRNTGGDPDSWEELRSAQSMSKQKTIGKVIKDIRNALAHGNIFIKGQPTIEMIVFVSSTYQGSNCFNFYEVTPQDFSIFIRNWFKFTRSLNMPNENF